MSLSEQLGNAIAQGPSAMVPGTVESPMRDGGAGLLVKLLRLRHDNYPGRDAAGVLPIVAVGHASMSEDAWKAWVRETGIAHYGAGYTERVLRDGIDLKEMEPTAGFGRAMREQAGAARARGVWRQLDRANAIVAITEKWPPLYNLLAQEMAEELMTLQEMMDRIYNLPAPWELGRGAQTTLGDLVGPPLHMVLPDY